jgi:hypothetical protein
VYVECVYLEKNRRRVRLYDTGGVAIALWWTNTHKRDVFVCRTSLYSLFCLYCRLWISEREPTLL